MGFHPRCQVVLEVLLEDFSGGTSSDLLQIIATPTRADWTRDHHRSADTISMELAYADLPLDPRSVRAIRVLLLCADVGAPDGQLDPDNEDHRVFYGYIDEPETTLEGGGETVRLQGRDLTALFLDHRYTGGAIDLAQPLSDIVAAILADTPGAENMPVVFDDGAASLVLADYAAGKTAWSPQADDDAWTVLVELCGRVGLLPSVVLDTVEIRGVANFGREVVSFLYGRDIERLIYRRRFNEARSAQVRVVCWDPSARTVTEAVYPPEPIVLRRRIRAGGKESVETAPEIRHPLQGSHTQERLDVIAEGLYEEAARQQIEGALTTRELADTDGTPLPRLGNGDQLQVRLGANLPNLAGLSQSEAVTLLTGARWGLSAAVAEALIEVWTQADSLASVFYIKEARHRWSISDGYSVEIGFINYIVGQS